MFKFFNLSLIVLFIPLILLKIHTGLSLVSDIWPNLSNTKLIIIWELNMPVWQNG